MKDLETTITDIQQLSNDYYILSINNVWQDDILPGQFAEITINHAFLRRPFSIFAADKDQISFLIKIVGQATSSLSSSRPGDKLRILLPLGNNFSIDKSKKPLLIGGGCGIAPMIFLAKSFVAKGIKPLLFWGEKSIATVPEQLRNTLKDLCEVVYFTEDGSLGKQGLVTDTLAAIKDNDMIFACGPTPMLKAVQQNSSLPAEFSLEAYMACGIGACMGCVIELKDSTFKRVCKDGPVFQGADLW
jgi:dihydroorotate dehydrogenase electron transfer subunit